MKTTEKSIAGYIYLLPSKTQKVIVKYYPKWLISAMIPAQTRAVESNKYDYYEDILVTRKFEIDFPDFILSHSWKKPWIDYPEHTTEYFQLHAYDPQATDAIKALPYRLANIYSSGSICFGEVSLEGMPKNLRQANNYFWGTPFNDDGSIFYDQHMRVCETREHEYYGCAAADDDECSCECCMGICACACACNLLEPYFEWFQNYTPHFKTRQLVVKTRYFCGDKYFATNNPATSLFIGPRNPVLEKLVPDTCWRKDAQASEVVIGVAAKNADSWDIDLGSFQFTIATTDAKVL